MKAGVPVAGSFETGLFFMLGFGESGASAARRFTGGPEALIHFTRWLGFELDALHQRLGFDWTTTMAGVFYTVTSAMANSWEFPLLGRVELPPIAGARPFVSAGPSFRTVSGVSGRFITSDPGGSGGGRATVEATYCGTFVSSTTGADASAARKFQNRGVRAFLQGRAKSLSPSTRAVSPTTSGAANEPVLAGSSRPTSPRCSS